MNDGRPLLLNVELEGQNICLVNVYAPNDITKRCIYFDRVSSWISKYAICKDNIIIGGDFNCCLNDEDRSTFTHKNDKSRKSVENMISKLNLYDPSIKT